MDILNQIIIKKNRRAHHLRLSINRFGQPVLTIPFLCPKWYALKWVQKQQGWIEKHTFLPTGFQPDQQITLCGHIYILKHDPNQKMNQMTDSQIIIGGESAFFNRRVRDLIKSQFLSHLKEKVKKTANRLNLPYGKITLRDTSSRWGSCSATGNLSFCWRIALAPDFVIDYLIAHEVSHLKHMDHGVQFWKTVNTLTPYTIRAKSWLKHNGKKLQMY